MENVPQIVRERLKAGVPVSMHPDADVLTAFAERSLPDGERATVLDHLSRCGDCRDVVALALPETEAAQTVAVPSRQRWVTWPAFRWGFVTAGVVIVALGVLQYQRRTQRATSMVAQQTARPEPYLQSPAASQAAPATPPTKQEADRYVASSTPAKKAGPETLDRDVRTDRLQAPSPKIDVYAGSVGGQPHYGPAQPALTQQQQQQAPARVRALGTAQAEQQRAGGAGRAPASETVEVQSQVLTASTEAKNAPSENLTVPAPSAPAEQLFDNLASPAVGKAKAVPAPPPPPAPVTPSNARWSISSAGGLQRSFDQGATWQDVDVNASSTVAQNFAAYSTNEVVLLEKSRARQKDADKKTALKEVAVPVFRAVAANGANVWAGGSNGTLYHSVDGGSHWARVVPTSGGAALSGDVVAVQFADLQTGTVTTSIPEVWTTSDGGLTWQKQ